MRTANYDAAPAQVVPGWQDAGGRRFLSLVAAPREGDRRRDPDALAPQLGPESDTGRFTDA